ncbi:MAG: HigA family addiction module antitoxin [Desulfobacterales bacterium]
MVVKGIKGILVRQSSENYSSCQSRRINEIVHGKRAITADTAFRLGRFFKMSPPFWLNLHNRFDLEATEGQLPDRLDKEIRVFSTDAVYTIEKAITKC